MMRTLRFQLLGLHLGVAIILLALLGPNMLAQELPAQETPAEDGPPRAGATPAPEAAQTEGLAEDDDQADPLAEVKRELDKMEARIRGDDEEGNANVKIVKDVIAQLEQEYIENHDVLIELRKADAAARDQLSKLERRQKIIAQHLIELDIRKSGGSAFDNQLYRELAQLQQRPEVRQNAELRRRIINAMQTMSRRRVQPPAKKTIAEITAPLVGDQHLAPVESGPQRGYPEASDGVLQEYRPHIKNLVCIRWNGLQLELDRDHWDRPFAQKQEEEIAKEVDALLAGRGYKTMLAGNNGPRVAMFGGQRKVQTNLSRLFYAMQEGQKVNRSSASGANGHHQLTLRTEKMEARLVTTPVSFSFDFHENDGRAAMLRIRHNNANGLSISTLGDITFRFRQAPDGAIEVVELAGEETFRFKAPSFADLYRDHVEYCELRLLPLFDHLGITVPLSRLDDQVIRCVVAELQALQQRRPDDARALIEQLGSEKYAQREEAMQLLREGVAFYRPTLEAALETPLSIEARMRIKSLLQDAKPSQTQELVAALQLLDDVEYLEVVQQRCERDAQPLVAARIKALQSE